jgi:thiol-disulfide isomerase/thioredoxin
VSVVQRALLVGFIVALGIGALAAYWYQSNRTELSVNRTPEGFDLIGEMEQRGVPDWTLKALDGSAYRLTENLGPATIINFWASWCNPCVEEFPSMLKLVQAMKGQVKIIAISTDSDRKDLENFVRAFDLPQPGFDIVWDEEGSVRKAYGVEKIPESFIVQRDGKLYRKVMGIEDWASEGAIGFFTWMISNPVLEKGRRFSNSSEKSQTNTQ